MPVQFIEEDATEIQQSSTGVTFIPEDGIEESKPTVQAAPMNIAESADRAGKSFDLSLKWDVPVDDIDRNFDVIHNLAVVDPATDLTGVSKDYKPGEILPMQEELFVRPFLAAIEAAVPGARRGFLTLADLQMGNTEFTGKGGMAEQIENAPWYKKLPEFAGAAAENVIEFEALGGIFKAIRLTSVLNTVGKKLASRVAGTELAKIGGKQALLKYGGWNTFRTRVLSGIAAAAPENMAFLATWETTQAARRGEPIGPAAAHGALWGLGFATAIPLVTEGMKAGISSAAFERASISIQRKYPKLGDFLMGKPEQEFIDATLKSLQEEAKLQGKPMPAGVTFSNLRPDVQNVVKALARRYKMAWVEAMRRSKAAETYWQSGMTEAEKAMGAAEAQASKTGSKAVESTQVEETQTVSPKSESPINAAPVKQKPAKSEPVKAKEVTEEQAQQQTPVTETELPAKPGDVTVSEPGATEVVASTDTQIVYRSSSKPYDPAKITERGIFVSPNQKWVQDWGEAQNRTEPIESFEISPDAKILKREDIPEEFITTENGDSFVTLESAGKLAEYARSHGYDGYENYSITKEGVKISHEYAIFNPDVLKPVSPAQTKPATEKVTAKKPKKADYPVAIDDSGNERTIYGYAVDMRRVSANRIGGSGWEWYALEPPKGDIVYGLVHGFETEYGSFSISELAENGIKFITDPKELRSLAPPIGWKPKSGMKARVEDQAADQDAIEQGKPEERIEQLAQASDENPQDTSTYDRIEELQKAADEQSQAAIVEPEQAAEDAARLYEMLKNGQPIIIDGKKYTIDETKFGYVVKTVENGIAITEGGDVRGGGYSFDEAWDKLSQRLGLDRPEPTTLQEPPKTPEQNIADQIADKLALNETISPDDFFAIADQAFGGTRASGKYGVSDAYDALELGVNKYLKGRTNPTVDAKQAAEQVKMIEAILDKLPTQRNRSGEKDLFQQFSTPPHYAYAINWIANIKPTDIYMEPEAGTGSLAVHGINASPAKTIANELSQRRAELLKSLGINEVYTEDAEQIHNILGDTVQPTVIVMNPPFSHAAHRMGALKVYGTDLKHIDASLKLLADDGRLVAIMGRPLHEEKGESQTFQKWINELKKTYSVRANIYVGRDVYKKYGTAFPTRVLVIDKTGPSDAVTIGGTVETIEELLYNAEGVRNDRRTIQPTAAQSVMPQKASTDTGEVGAGVSIQSATGNMGTGAAGETQRTVGNVPSGAARTGTGDARLETGERSEDVPAGPGAELGAKPDESSSRPDRGVLGQPPAETAKPTDTGTAVTTEKRDKEFTEAVFQGYKPTVTVPGSKSHPGSLVESAAMASVDIPPVNYKINLPKTVITKGLLSDVQLESIALVGQAHSKTLPANADGIVFRKGFMIGDGTGVGKGRQIAGVIFDNWNQGRKKAIWVSQNQKLFEDAIRDWTALGGNKEHVFNLTNVKSDGAISAKEGILYSTYATVRSKAKAKDGKEGKKRIEQILEWVGDDFDGVLVFDEAHNMANSTASLGGRGLKKPSAQALMSIELQRKLPNARVLYASATSATEVSNFAYAERLGMWGAETPFANKLDFISEIASGGVASMESIAKDMKALGLYVSRGLSYNDGTEAGTVKYRRIDHVLTPDQTSVYNELAKSWQIVLQNIEAALKLCGAAGSGKAKMFAASQFWSTLQRFFNQIITAMQTPSVINSIEKDLAEGRSAVIQLTNTNEASQERALADRDDDEDLDDFDATPRDILMQFIEHSFPVAQYEEFVDENGNLSSRPVLDSKGNNVTNKDAIKLRDTLLDKLGSIRVPESPLDMIINHFGADVVAEVTGRKRRVILKKQPTGQFRKEIDSRSKNSNKVEISKFMAGKKRVLIFSEAGGTGASYHADNTQANTQMREHYLLQPGWRADAAMQGLGRTHRTNQKQAPEYILVTTNLKGQKRFISSIARRLDQLGALTKGERRAGATGIFSAADNLESTEAKDALQVFLHDIVRNDVEGIDLADFQRQTGLKLVDEKGNQKKELPTIQQFLNRLLSLTVDMQDKVFDEFDARLQQKVDQAMRDGSLDQGLETYHADKIVKADEQTVYTHPESGATTKYIQLQTFKKTTPISFTQVERQNPLFFVKSERGKVYSVTPAHARTDANTGQVISQYKLTDQQTWHYIDQGNIDYDYRGRWQQITKEQAKPLWEQALKNVPEFTERTEHVISGLMIPIWDRLEGKAKIYRFKTDDGQSVIGRIVPEESIDSVLERLGAGRQAPEMDTTTMHANLEAGAVEVHLANKWKLKSAMVSGETRIELVGPEYQDVANIERLGVFSERVQYKTRYFIPTGAEGQEVLERLVKAYPVASISQRASSGGHRFGGNRPGFALNPLEEIRDIATNLSKKIDDLLQERAILAEKQAENTERVKEILPSIIEHHKAYRQALIEAQALKQLILDAVPKPSDQMNMVHAYEQMHNPKYWDQLNDLQKALVGYMETVGAKIDKAAIDNGLVEPRQFREGVRYLFHWQRNKEGMPYAGNYGKFSKNLPQSKQRKHETYEDSMAAGVAPVSQNLGEILGEQLKAVMGAKSTRDMYRTMSADRVTVRPWKKVVAENDTENYIRYHDQLLDKPIVFQAEDGTKIILKTDVGIHKDFYPYWKAYRENPSYGLISKANFVIRSWKFAISMFHPYALALQDMMLSKYPLDITKPFRDVYAGSQIRKNILKDEVTQLLYRNGLGETGRETKKDYVLPIPGIRQVQKLFNHIIFDVIQQDLKFATAYNNYIENEGNLAKLGLTKEELARQSVKLADSLFSGEDIKLAALETTAFMNKFYFSPEARKRWTFMFMSPTWQREHLIAGKNVLKAVIGEGASAKAGMNEDISGSRRAYLRYLRNALIAYAASNLYNYVVTKQKDGKGRFSWENPDPFSVRAWYNQDDGRPVYFRPFKSIYELPEFAEGIIHGNFGKLTSKLTAPIAAAVNQFWPQYSKYDEKGIQGWLQRAVQIAIDLGVPMSAGNVGKAAIGEKQAGDVVLPFFGLPTSTYSRFQQDLIAAYEDGNDAEAKRIIELARANKQKINIGSAKDAARKRIRVRQSETILQYLGLESKSKKRKKA